MSTVFILFLTLIGGRIFGIHWLRTLRQNFARVVSLTAFQHVSKHAMLTLTQSCLQWYKVATEENKKKRKFCAVFFSFFGPVFLILETSSQQSVKTRAMLCNQVWKSYSRVLFTMLSAGAFRSLQILSGAKTYHNAIPG